MNYHLVALVGRDADKLHRAKGRLRLAEMELERALDTLQFHRVVALERECVRLSAALKKLQ